MPKTKFKATNHLGSSWQGSVTLYSSRHSSSLGCMHGVISSTCPLVCTHKPDLSFIWLSAGLFKSSVHGCLCSWPLWVSVWLSTSACSQDLKAVYCWSLPTVFSGWQRKCGWQWWGFNQQWLTPQDLAGRDALLAAMIFIVAVYSLLLREKPLKPVLFSAGENSSGTNQHPLRKIGSHGRGFVVIKKAKSYQ